ncbi:MAG: hypothetical protein U0359_12405 [Byssovorax sp.]
MIRRSFVLLAVVFATLTLLGCGPRWGVIVQAAPNPFLGVKKVAVLPIDYTGLRVGAKTEAAYVSSKEDKQAESFQEDKAGINEEFTRALIARAADQGIEVVLASGPGQAPFEIRPAIQFLEPGFYAVVASKPSQVNMTVQITSADGRVLDELTAAEVVPADITNPSSGGRYRSAGKALGAALGKYLAERAGLGG